MTYREAFDAVGKPRKPPSLRRHYRLMLARWLAVAAIIMLWAVLVAHLEGAA